MLSPLNAILNMAQSNPNIANNPQAQAMLNVVKSGDAQKGRGDCKEPLQHYGNHSGGSNQAGC